jgi:hypothetical protein
MEFCSIDDAFPDLTAKSTARKEERRKAKKCRGPALTFLEPDTGLLPVTDPDRPAMKPQPEVPPLNPKTGLREHAPVEAPQAEAFTDGSEYEQLLAALRSQQPPKELEKVLTTLPTAVAGPSKLEKGKVPAFFGASDEEDDTTEGFASFTNVIGDDPGYKLSPDFTKTFTAKGVSKAAGTDLPPVPANNFWKPLVSGTSNTAFYSKIPPPSKRYVPSPVAEDQGEVLRKLDKIFARLDDLESRRSENANTEVVLFVMSGLFVMFTMDLLVRKTGNVRLMK